MNKVLVITSLAFILSACTNNPSFGNNIQSQAPLSLTPQPTPYTVEGSVISLLNGENKRCTWSTKIQDNNVNGTVYINDQKFRAEATTSISFFPVTATAIGDGTTITAWASIAPDQKVSYSYEEMQKMREQLQAQTQNTNNPILEEVLKNQTFICDQWTPDQSKFEVN